ncbi:MAG: nitroreductase family protein [Candidatus Micrarchaeia archaeon]
MIKTIQSLTIKQNKYLKRNSKNYVKQPVMNALKARRSVRAYKDEPVPRSQVKKILEAGVASPSAHNRQPWRFIIISGKQKVRQAGEAVLRAYGEEKLARKWGKAFNEYELPFYGAPLLVIICAEKGSKWNALDSGICAQSMMLAAHEAGLASCFIGYALALNNDAEALEKLGVPQDHEITAAIVFGYAAKKPRSPGRNPPKILKWI